MIFGFNNKIYPAGALSPPTQRGGYPATPHEAVIVKDLESTPLGRQVKGFLVTDVPRAKEVELFGFLCCKAHLFNEIVRKEMERGAHVICDRGVGSFLSYFEVMGFDKGFLSSALSVAVPFDYVSITFLLDADVEEALQRNVSKTAQSKFDSMGRDFFEKQRKVFLRLADERRWTVVSGNDSIESIHSIMCSAVKL